MGAVGPATTRLVVAVPTFRRVGLLRRLLPELVRQADAVGIATVLVCDNDPDGSARGLVEEWAERGVRYVHEVRPGLAAVRNRLLSEAGDVDAIAFIDDDEFPDPEWLPRLLTAWSDFECAAVTGPVDSVFEVEPSAWVMATGIFTSSRRDTGTKLSSAASNNLLLDVKWLRRVGIEFDPSFGASGGEDTMLMSSIFSAGGTIRWCEEARVTETVPSTRLTRAWITKRLVRTSNAWARVRLKMGATQGGAFKSWLWVAVRVPYFLLRALRRGIVGALTMNIDHLTAAFCDFYCAVGVGRAVIGSISEEYGRPASSN